MTAPDAGELARKAAQEIGNIRTAQYGSAKAVEAVVQGAIDAALAAAREERDIAVKSSNDLFTSRRAVLADLNAAEQREAALKAELETLKTRVANDSLAIERLEGKWCVEVVDNCPHDEKTWVCCSDCHASAIKARDALQAQVETLKMTELPKGWMAAPKEQWDALRAELILLADGMGHDDPDCPADDTCSCANVARVVAALASTAPAEEPPKELVPDPGYCGLLSKPLVIALQGMERALRTLSAAHRAALDAEAAEPQPEPTEANANLACPACAGKGHPLDGCDCRCHRPAPSPAPIRDHEFKPWPNSEPVCSVWRCGQPREAHAREKE